MIILVDMTLRVETETRIDDAERALVDRAVGGDAQAFAALYDRHLTRVYRYVYYWVSNRVEAEDLTQQVFLNAWQAIGRYKHTGVTFVAWLLRIAHNQVVSLYRRAKETRMPDIAIVSQDRWSDPEALALANSDRASVRRAILHLKPEQQQVVVMRFIGQFDYAEVAASVGKSEGAVRVIQHRALLELRRLLANEVKA